MRSRRQSYLRKSSFLVPDDGTFSIDDQICQSTKLASQPCPHMVTRKEKSNIVSTTKMLLARESNYSGRGRFSLSDCSHVLGRYLPVNGPKCVDRVNSQVYVSQFSADGSLFVAGFQGSRIRIYNTQGQWKVKKNIHAQNLQWTITDIALSPDKRHLVYSSLNSIVHIVSVQSAATESQANVTDIHDGLDFSLHPGNQYSFGIFSVKYSSDGRELVAGSNDESIYVYDLEASKLTLRCEAHMNDVNSVTFADETGHLIYSASDDHLCKVWDRRCFMETRKPVGVLTGHIEGITFIDSRKDGYYFISNGKDQTIKMWDIRKMSSNPDVNCPRTSSWDYRWMEYPEEARRLKHPQDQSVATYRGHSVLCTLIRCYFSPEFSTGQKYIYTGSSDECVYIYDVLTGSIAAKLAWHGSIIRDCSWHPHFPKLVSSSWDCCLAMWEFPGTEAEPAATRRRSMRRYID